MYTKRLILLMIVAAQRLLADSWGPPTEEAVYSANRQFVLVTLAQTAPPEERSYVEINPTLRRYPRSGVYKVGSSVPEWTIDWFYGRALLSGDGRFLIRYGPTKFRDLIRDDLAIEFYDRGVCKRRYAVHELVKEYWRLPQSVSFYTLTSLVSFEGRENAVRFVTAMGDEYEFETATGRIVSHRDAPIWPAALLLLATGLAIFLAFTFSDRLPIDSPLYRMVVAAVFALLVLLITPNVALGWLRKENVTALTIYNQNMFMAALLGMVVWTFMKGWRHARRTTR